MWDLIIPVPDHCLSFYFLVHAWTSGPYANFWNLKVFSIVEEYVE